jgi:hypothetical protein
MAVVLLNSHIWPHPCAVGAGDSGVGGEEDAEIVEEADEEGLGWGGDGGGGGRMSLDDEELSFCGVWDGRVDGGVVWKNSSLAERSGYSQCE